MRRSTVSVRRKVTEKINDLTNSPLRKKYLDQEYEPLTNIAVGMGRVSTKGQKDRGQSDAAQIETIEAYAVSKSLNLVKVWDVAETASKHHQRREFKAMLDFVRENKNIRHILFSHQSRSNRNRDSADELANMVRRDGITLHCARDGLVLHDKSPLEDWLRWDLFNHLNAKYIKDHTNNVMDGVFKRMENGLAHGQAPFGYLNYRRPEDQLSVFKFDEQEAPCVKRAFELFATGRYSEPTLRAELVKLFPNLRYIPRAKEFSKLLRNPFFYGDFLYKGEVFKGDPDLHPPLIEFSLWKSVQNVLNSPGRIRPRVTDRNHPYLGLVRCGGMLLDDRGRETDDRCGARITCEEKRKKNEDGTLRATYHLWHCCRQDKRCSQRSVSFMKKQKLNASYSEAALEDIFVSIFESLRFPAEVCQWMQEALRDHHQDVSGESSKRMSALQSRYTMLDRYMNQAYEDKLSGTLLEGIWREKNEKWMAERSEISRELSTMAAGKSEYLENGVLFIELTQHLENTYRKAKPEVKRKLIELVSSNRFLRNGTLEFDYEKPFDMLSNCGKKEEKWSIGESNS
ncbi:MAG: hypothetical protein EOP10_24865 [Proteobacteria bacterium]|nr:MAG: hypothetical protein EOP10_24865 [Pseudomonadota bacterium]